MGTDAYTTALTLLSRRELSVQQLRDRLTRRKFDLAEINAVIDRLRGDGTLDDRRVAVLSARIALTKRRGRRRVVQQVQRLGITGDTAKAAVDEVFDDVDEAALLDQALARKLRGADPRTLDQKATARVVRSLVSQGFQPSAVYARLRRKDAKPDE